MIRRLLFNTGLLVVVVCLCVTPILIRYPWLVPTMTSRMSFDPVQWRKNDIVRGVNARQRMVRDVIRRFHFVGMSRKQVELVLGAARDGGRRKDDFMYYLGTQQGPFPFDSEWLFFDLGRDGKVTKVYTGTD